MEYLFIEINAVWRWLGTAVLGGLVTLFLWLVWDIIKGEIRWWRKNREYLKYIESERGRK